MSKPGVVKNAVRLFEEWSSTSSTTSSSNPPNVTTTRGDGLPPQTSASVINGDPSPPSSRNNAPLLEESKSKIHNQNPLQRQRLVVASVERVITKDDRSFDAKMQSRHDLVPLARSDSKRRLRKDSAWVKSSLVPNTDDTKQQRRENIQRPTILQDVTNRTNNGMLLPTLSNRSKSTESIQIPLQPVVRQSAMRKNPLIMTTTKLKTTMKAPDDQFPTTTSSTPDDSIDCPTIQPTPSIVLQRKQQFEMRSRNNGLGNQIYTRNRNLRTTSDLSVAVTQPSNEMSWIAQWMADSPTGQSVMPNRKYSTPSRRWKRFWELLYAALAILELLSCSKPHIIRKPLGGGGGGVSRSNDVPVIASSSAPMGTNRPEDIRNLSHHIKKIGNSTSRTTRTLVASAHIQWQRLDEAFQKVSWEEWINKAFILAIFIHTMFESWAAASSRNERRRAIDEAKAKESSVQVTRRTKRRFYKLETSSTNRHFIMRWTGNRIKWSRATTEIFRASCFILLFRLLFLPILKKNPFVAELQKKAQGMNPFTVLFSPQRQKDVVATANRTLSFGEAVILNVTTSFHSKAMKHLRRKAKSYALRFATLALTRPWETSSRVQRVFTAIRWAKFIAPLFGTCNKLRGHYLDYKKKQERKRRSERAQLAWKNLLNSVRAEKRLERVVRKIQRQFRTRRERILLQHVLLMQERRTDGEIAKIQRRFRARAALARERVARAKKRLSGIGVAKQILSNDHRELADSLRMEIRERSRKNRRLLLRPNTTFAVSWKRTTITCVVIEVTQLLLAPKLAPHTRKISIEELVKVLLTLSPERFTSVYRFQLWIVAVDFLSRRIDQLVSLVSLLDVFITFFTGELDDQTGLLVPKSSLARWVFPGVCLQLIVNPSMKDISTVVNKVINFAKEVGPMRVFHVSVALLPIIRACVDSCIDVAFHFVAKENRNVSFVKKHKVTHY